jgi:UDP-N-acetylmuramoyl-tripeptide--D-alanyl-D-alanine ligase
MSAMGQPLWTACEAERACGGKSTAPWAATGLSIDSRELSPEDLFVAIKGDRFDGHDFISDAAQAAAVIVQHIPKGMDDAMPALLVSDTNEALCDLARAARARTEGKIIAITGSVGKTGTKEMLKATLSAQGKTTASEGNLNNHWGLPLSLARMPEGDDFGVFEMGMNHPGEIAALSDIARPHVAVITAVEEAHSEFFKSVTDIADAKAEIFSGMAAPGTAVLNRDNAHYSHLTEAAKAAGVAKIISFGASEEADVRLVALQENEAGIEVDVSVFGQRLSYSMAVHGRHWAMNALAVLGAVVAVGGSLEKATSALAQIEAPDGRGRIHRIALSGGEFLLIDESYNANPASMSAALGVLGDLVPGEGGRRIAVLGDMLELGPRSKELHEALAEPIKAAALDAVFCVGQDMACLVDLLPKSIKAIHQEDQAKTSPLVEAMVRPGDVVMVKGSAGLRCGAIVEDLLALNGNQR